MEAYVKESLYVLDYDNNIVDAIFLSDDHITAGYAYDITITEANTGYSDLKFNMPNMIIDEEGNKVHNPKLKLLTPLVKLRYQREVYYMGDTPIKVREPQGYGDTVTYIDKEYKNTFPDNRIERYVMDYIVQPVDRKRDILKLTTSYTAIDYPRFNLSKKKVGLTIAQETLAAKPEWSIYKNAPMDVEGQIHYQLWTTEDYGTFSNITEWDPARADRYPLEYDEIYALINSTDSWTYGKLGTAFYWPIVSTGRFEGKLYTKGGYLVLHLYDYLALGDAGISPEHHVNGYGWEWSYLEEVDTLLAPNNALNYLRHILIDTNWSVALREDGQPDVEIEELTIPNPDGSLEKYRKQDHTCNLSISNGNCYNAITALCQAFQLYPIYNCEERTVALRLFSGKNYGLVYRLGGNLSSNAIKNDGEKVITKLYVTGGQNNVGNQNITIGTANRSYVASGINPDTKDPWNPNDPEYIVKRSPYGTNYILNFKWMYDNNWMSKEDILGLYAINEQMDERNREFMPSYAEDRTKTLEEYGAAVNDYDIKQGEYQSTLNSMMNKYYNTYGEISEGYFYAFHKSPLGTHKKTVNGKERHFLWIGHCKKCGYTESFQDEPTETQICSCADAKKDIIELYIPVYGDFPDVVAAAKLQYPYGPEFGAEYEPLLKGDYLKLLTTLDNENADWDIEDYESKISLIEPIQFKAGSNTIDDREYQIGDVYVKASSAHIDEWNQDIALFVKAYGEMLDAEDRINHSLLKIQKLDEEYAKWEAEVDGYHAQIQKEYGDFIIEGNYTNNEQPYVGLLFEEGMEASDKYAIPEVTYTLDVIDSSGLIEYRMPQVTRYTCAECEYTTLEYIKTCPICGDDTIVKDHDTYNDLVHLLHSVGQIVPKAGDYVTVYDEPMGLFGVPAMITEISRTLDKPVNNKIKLDTGYTDNEELVGNIITATNTVLNHADIYARTAVLKADGTIDSDSIARSIDNPNANLNFVGTNGNMLLTNSYLRFTNPTDPTKAMKYSGTGIFSTTTLSESGAATDWQKMMTPSGINATYINAGQIDVKNVSIMSGVSSKILLDQYGLVVKNAGNKSAHISSFDSTRAKNEANYTRNWSTNNNIAGFMGVDPSNNPVLFTKGFLVAENGSNIAGWVTSTDEGNAGFFHLKDDTTSGEKDLWLSPTGIQGTVNSNTTDYAIYSKGNFGVTTGGNLYATGANIRGKIVVTTDDSSINQGTVGGWTASSSGLKVTGIELSPAGGTEHTVNGHTASNWAIWANNNFGVTTAGYLYAKDAEIDGKITADSGSIGGWTIGDSSQSSNEKKKSLYYGTFGSDGSVYLIPNGSTSEKKIGGGTRTDWVITAGDSFGVTKDGGLYASDATIEGKITATSGSIGGCDIDANGRLYIPSGRVTGNFSAGRISGGKLNIESNGGGYLRVGEDTNHPEVSGVNVGTSGVLFGSQSANTSITGDSSDMTLTYGSGSLVMKANGGDDQLTLQTGGLTADCMVNLKGGLKADGEPGLSQEIYIMRSTTDRWVIKVKYGLIVDYFNSSILPGA